MRKKILNIVYWSLLTVLVSTAVLVLFSSMNGRGLVKFYTVNSGSMSPAIYTGSMAVVRPQAEYEVGDIITFSSKDKSMPTVTHRVMGVETEEDGSTVFITKGDANESRDADKISKEAVLGRVSADLPLLGYLVAFSRTFWGWLFLLVVPATLFVVNEINAIRKEVQALT